MNKIMKSMGIIFCAVLVTCCSLPRAKVVVEPIVFNHPDEIIKGTGHTEGNWVIADRRIFAVMAFLNIAGYDEEVTGMEMHPLRHKVRRLIAENLAEKPDKLKICRQYYQERLLGVWQYTNFALSLSSDYPFRRIRPDRELTYAWTSWELSDLPEVLNDFWVTAGLERIWAECRDDYIAEIKRYNVQRMSEQMTYIWGYMKTPRKDTYTVIHIPNPLYRHATADAHTFENYFYSIDGPSSNDGGLNIHEYLHTFINDLVGDNYVLQESKLQKYFEAGKDTSISASYQELSLWTTECLVHALDYRIRVNISAEPAYKKQIEAKVDSLTQQGYTVLKSFYELLADFEKNDMPFDKYLPIMLEKLPEYSQ
ncbi:hypothetical protein ACFLZ8_05715 [Planctomycetota bacterium]